MARPKKNNAAYFAHDANFRNDLRVKALRRKFPNIGYMVLCFFHEVLTESENFEHPFGEKEKEKRLSQRQHQEQNIVAATTTKLDNYRYDNAQNLEFLLRAKNKAKKSKVNNSSEYLNTHSFENIKKLEEQNGFLFDCLCYDDEHTFFFLQMVEKEMWIEQVGMNYHLDKKDVYRYLDLFVIDTRAGSVQHTDLNDCKRHFNAWLGQRLSVENNKKIKNNGSNGNTIDRRRGYEPPTGLKKSDFEGSF